ncbi:hypothetical protein GCM10028798_22050 [Humibacter antri]
MSLQLKRDVHRWSAWYPVRWREQNAAAMLGTYLDLADAEGRERLTGTEKIAMVAGGLAAHLDRTVPGAVRDHLAAVMIGLLGAFGLITGVIFEWAPWATAARTQWLDPFGNSEPPAFGPFLSAFAIVVGFAMATWVSSLFGPTWLYRCLLAATAIAGITIAGVGHSGLLGDQPWLSSPTCAFTALIALMALPARRPRPPRSLASAAIWIAAFCTSSIAFGPWTPAHFFTGEVPVREFFSGVVQPMLANAGSVIALVAALAFALARRPTTGAVIVLATIPWSFISVTRVVSLTEGAYVGELTLLAPLMVGYAAAVVFAIVFRRQADARTETERATGIGISHQNFQ